MNRVNKLLVFTSTLFLFVSCGETPQKEDSPSLISISLTGNYQTDFSLNESFNYDDLVVTAYFSDDTSKVVNDYQISTPDMSTVGDKEISVTYLNVSESYTISVNQPYQGYIQLAFYHIDIALNDNSGHYLNPTPIDYEPNPELIMPYSFTSSDTSIATVSNGGGIKSSKNKTGSCVITCAGDTGLVAKCTVNVLQALPEKEKGWVRVDDYNSLSNNDILVMASPEHGVTASLDTLNSKLHPVNTTFSSDKKTITKLGEGSIEFVLGIEQKGMTLEAQTGEYLVCTHQGKVKLDASSKTNKYWDIHSNIDPETGIGSILDGAVIENNVESLGYMMFNITAGYFTTYVDNSISKYMSLPFLYRLQELK